MIRAMVRITAVDPGSCPACGGRGYKLMSLRRSLATAGAVSERRMLRRRRVPCLECQTPVSGQARQEVQS
jgi:hypothetical protein